ncbi:MAG: phosphoribosylglycinamide formyltransferase [Methylococcales bacterium]|nr:phosphoribosylglycinamide formyltransferase [Methylococcales bacterium]
MKKTRLGFLVSHRGTNMQAIIDNCRKGDLNAEPVVVITNNESCQALQRAGQESIPSYVANTRVCADINCSPDDYILQKLLEHQVELLILAGYMIKIGANITSAFAGRIMNIHPSLLPKYGGKGMFGLHVHEAVLAAGDTETGVTIHLVDEEYDQGPVLAQAKVAVELDDTPETLAARVLKTEHRLLIETLKGVLHGDIATGLTETNPSRTR